MAQFEPLPGLPSRTGVPAPGRLLVSAPAMGDPNFARTIVLLLEAGTEGALGVVLNRPTPVPVAEALDSAPGWGDALDRPTVLFRGGPVQPDAALALARVRDADLPGWRPVHDGIGLLDLDLPAELIADHVTDLRVFSGYSGWGGSQLEGEVAEGAWYVVDSDPADAFAADPDDLWARVLRRQGGALALLSTLPTDPLRN